MSAQERLAGWQLWRSQSVGLRGSPQELWLLLVQSEPYYLFILHQCPECKVVRLCAPDFAC